ncbi:hypothetical protein R1sor_003973 [Riccia sorocarpa]|uniref:FCP1 homology domain-containing protein n=1 Tax=Riccia sorocarpa TaxID=122646 RepID=A0ABD3H5B5_9MARC
MFQLINGLLLARRRIRDGFGRLALTVKTYIDGSREFDWGQMILDSLHTEIMFLQKHVQKEKPIRVALTFLGQVLTWFFLYKRLIPVLPEPPVELPAPPLSPQPPTGGETESSQVHILGFKPTLLHPTEPRQKILILALDGILCCVFHVWNQDKCEKAELGQALAESGDTFWMKDFRHLYDWNICTRDVLLIDEYVSANALNHPYNAVHPQAFQPSFLAPKNDIFLVQNLLPWLQTWNASPAPTTDYVWENYKTLTTRGAMEGIKFLAIEKLLRLVGCLWRNVSVHEQKILVAEANANQPSTATASLVPPSTAQAQSDSSPPTTRRDTEAPSAAPFASVTGRAVTGRGKGRSSASRAPRVTQAPRVIQAAGRGTQEAERGTQDAGRGTNFARCSGRGGRVRILHKRPKVAKDHLPPPPM